jgi:hypothetical protein
VDGLQHCTSLASCISEFVVIRMSEIQELTSVNDCHHISTKDNPAHVITRGMYPETLIKSEIWWHGPRFLSKDLSAWPVSIPAPIPEDTGILETRKTALTTCIQSELPVISKFSSFVKLQRVIAYCLRFINNCRNKNQRVNGSLTCLELIQAHNRIIAYVQKREFAEEIHILSHESKNKKLNKNSRLLSLNPFIDPNDNLLRVGGRIGNSNFSYDKKHQIFLPSKQYVTRLLIKQYHEQQLHGGQQLTLAALRQKYWPVAAQS